MRIGYFDCFSGASGDMIVASMLDAGLRIEDLERELEKLGLGTIAIESHEVRRKGIRARSFRFSSKQQSVPVKYAGIVDIIKAAGLSEKVKEWSLKAFDLLATAEAKVHGIAREEVHFHEVGSLDSIVDVVGAMIGIEFLGLEEVVSSPLSFGTGSVECEHGILPVPSPATLELARGLPARGWKIESELTTPTGVAILRACASYFGEMPAMEVHTTGYGAGTRELDEIPNVMRLVIGEKIGFETDRAYIVETNIDDMNPEVFSHLIGDLLSMGALDAWVTNIIMKKGRPAFKLSFLCAQDEMSRLINYTFTETTTSGVRIHEVGRYKLQRRVVEVETRFGKIRAKVFETPSGTRCVPEYEDCLKAARTKAVPVSEVMDEVRHVFKTKACD